MTDELQTWTDDVDFALKKCPSREQVKTVTWIPLAMLYAELVTRREIKPLADLKQEMKQKYWQETDGALFRRKSLAQAFYMWDLLMSENRQT